MPKRKLPPVEIIDRPRVVRCLTCLHEDGLLSEWIHATLEEHIAKSKPQPRLEDFFAAARKHFPAYAALVSESAFLHHLTKDEPLWKRKSG